MGLFDWLFGKKSEEWYRSELEPFLSEYKTITRLYNRGIATGSKFFAGSSPESLKKSEHELTEQISGLIREMKKYGYKYDDLLKKYDAEHFR